MTKSILSADWQTKLLKNRLNSQYWPCLRENIHRGYKTLAQPLWNPTRTAFILARDHNGYARVLYARRIFLSLLGLLTHLNWCWRYANHKQKFVNLSWVSPDEDVAAKSPRPPPPSRNHLEHLEDCSFQSQINEVMEMTDSGFLYSRRISIVNFIIYSIYCLGNSK